MFKFNNSIVPNKVRIGWHFSSNKYAYRDAYSALKSRQMSRKTLKRQNFQSDIQTLLKDEVPHIV